MNLTSQVTKILICPSCNHHLTPDSSLGYRCVNSSCKREFPIINQIPILINDENSLFNVNDFIQNKATTVPTQVKYDNLKRLVKKIIPKITNNFKAKSNYKRLENLILENCKNPIILIVGSGEIGVGLEKLFNNPHFTIVETDVYFSSRVQIIADGHDLPFQDESFDAVICQAVLEHVINPYRCVDEIHRVLKGNGLVYAETPFMYPVHLGSYDFTRFTLGGHRYLFRNFEQIDAGLVLGPGTTLALSILYFFRSFSSSRIYQRICNLVIPFFIFWLKYFDYFLIDQPSASDAASGIFFLGKRSDLPVPDQKIINWHWTNQINK